MKIQGCKSRLCMLVCGWLWISGLLLMGKILGSLGSSPTRAVVQASHIDAVGSLQIFFLLYTAACLGLFVAWRTITTKNMNIHSPGI